MVESWKKCWNTQGSSVDGSGNSKGPNNCSSTQKLPPNFHVELQKPSQESKNSFSRLTDLLQKNEDLSKQIKILKRKNDSLKEQNDHLKPKIITFEQKKENNNNKKNIITTNALVQSEQAGNKRQPQLTIKQARFANVQLQLHPSQRSQSWEATHQQREGGLVFDIANAMNLIQGLDQEKDGVGKLRKKIFDKIVQILKQNEENKVDTELVKKIKEMYPQQKKLSSPRSIVRKELQHIIEKYFSAHEIQMSNLNNENGTSGERREAESYDDPSATNFSSRSNQLVNSQSSQMMDQHQTLAGSDLSPISLDIQSSDDLYNSIYDFICSYLDLSPSDLQ